MRKICTFLMLLAAMSMSGTATEFEFQAAEDLYQTKDGFTVALAQGSGQTAPAATMNYQTQEPEVRLYVGNTITVSGTDLQNIQIVFARTSASKGDYADLSASNGTLVSSGTSTATTDLKLDQWTGNATEVVFTLIAPGKQRQIMQLVINGDSVEIVDPEVQPLPTEDDLDLGYEYKEPEIVQVPDTQIFHKEYAFIDGNILVHCDSGSIVKAKEEEETNDESYSKAVSRPISVSVPIRTVRLAENLNETFSFMPAPLSCAERAGQASAHTLRRETSERTPAADVPSGNPARDQ